MNIICKLWLSILLLLLPIATLADDSPYYGIGDQLIYDGEPGSVPGDCKPNCVTAPDRLPFVG